MQATVSVIKDISDLSLLTLYEAKLGLNMLTSSTTEAMDDQIEMLIRFSSDEIALQCNRTFAKQTVQETFREIDNCKRIFVANYPIVNIDSVVENDVILAEDVDYEVELETGKITRLGVTTWAEPVVIIYTGGYDLPNSAPDSLRQAAILLTRETYYATIRGDASIKLVAHKESRVSYFDPKAGAGAAGGSSGPATPARRAIADILGAYTRYQV